MMETTIPFQEGLLLGRSVDMKSLKYGYMLIDEKAISQPVQMNQTSAQFSFVHTLRDACDILSIPVEYALKVMIDVIHNETVSSLLEGIGRKNSFTLVLKASYLQQKQYLPQDAVPKRGIKNQPSQEIAGTEGKADGPSRESLIADAVSDLSLGEATHSPPDHGTHWVRAVEVGDELITILRITGPDKERQSKLFNILTTTLEMYRGQLDSKKMAKLHKAAEKLDKKLSSNNYKDFKLEVFYCSHRSLERRLKSASGMVSTVEHFMDQSLGWANFHRQSLDYEAQVSRMSCNVGTDVEYTSILSGYGNQETSLSYIHGAAQDSHPVITGSPGNDGEGDSFVVIKTMEPKDFFNLRVTLQAFEGESDDLPQGTSLLSSLALIQYPESTYNMFDRMFQLYKKCEMAGNKLQDCLFKKDFLVEDAMEEAKRMMKSVQGSQIAAHTLISGLDLITIPSEQDVSDLLNSDPLDAVNLYIESVVSRLPKGIDLDLLIIGKTGHGKSATGNSILGINRFEESPNEESVTAHTSVEWADIDGRTIKVVDTPGVCDTKHDSDQSSIDAGIRSISEAIASCPSGFHALLLVIQFGQRMTMEERKAVGLLKCILGDDIIKNHTICIITFGDRFETEIVSKDSTTFSEWCRTRSGFLKEIFEECNYRCILFNNKTKDPRVRKSQLISLVRKVDKLQVNGKRYTNSLFEFAQAERERAIREEKAPQASEEMMRDIQLVLEHLKGMVDNTDKHELKDKLYMLKAKVDSLSGRLSDVEDGQMGTLVDTVFSLAENIHARMGEIADRREPDQPDQCVGSEACNTPSDTEVKSSSTMRDQNTLVYPEGAGIGNSGSDGAGVENSKDDVNFLQNETKELQQYYDNEIKPTSYKVVNRVTEEVAKKVKKEKQCFPGDAKVFLAGGSSVKLGDLKVGDQVLCVRADGQIISDTVYMFGHQEPDVWGHFVVLTTCHRSVAVTADHFVLCIRDGKEVCLPAGAVSAGDSLQVWNELGESDSSYKRLSSELVTKVGWETKRGLFAPFTHSGTLFVDGALMSCYVNVFKASTCHALLWPVRQLYKVSPKALAAVNSCSSQKSIPGWAEAVLKLM